MLAHFSTIYGSVKSLDGPEGSFCRSAYLRVTVYQRLSTSNYLITDSAMAKSDS
jgi:hypothetical protein